MDLDDVYNPRPTGADRLEEGFFLLPKRRSGRVDVPIRIWFGPPEEPESRQRWNGAGQCFEYVPIAQRALLDRSPRWQVEINGVIFGDVDAPACIAGWPVEDIGVFWPQCSAHPIDGGEYEYRVARAEHAEQHDEFDPYGGTAARIDPMTARLPFL